MGITLMTVDLSNQINDEIVNVQAEGAFQEINSDNYPLNALKVYQYITNINGSGSLTIGGFIKGDSSFSSLNYNYAALLFSDKLDIITRSDGSKIFKRYGFGIKVVLRVTDIKASMNVSFGSMAASAKMGLANVQYRIESYGVPENIIENYVDLAGDFNYDSYQKIISCVKGIKDFIGNHSGAIRLFPIEELAPVAISPDEEDSRSFYFGADSIANGLRLRDAIEKARRNRSHVEDEDIISFMYKYFGMESGLSTPSEGQKKIAKEWINGTYNKTQSTGYKDQWVSVEPILNDNGQFVSLQHLGDDYKPHELPEDWKVRAKAEYFDNISVSFQSSSELQISAIADVSSDYNSKTIIFDAMIYWDIYDAEPKGKILETRYGVGVRMKMKITEMEFGIDIDFAAVGASAELGLANVGYDIRGIGINDKKIIKDLPDPKDIDESTIEGLLASFKKLLVTLGNSDLNDFNPQPIAIRVKDATDVDPALIHQSVTFAYQKIRRRKKLRQILSEARNNNLDIKTIKETYADFSITDENDRPTYSNKRDAAEWLEID